MSDIDDAARHVNLTISLDIDSEFDLAKFERSVEELTAQLGGVVTGIRCHANGSVPPIWRQEPDAFVTQRGLVEFWSQEYATAHDVNRGLAQKVWRALCRGVSYQQIQVTAEPPNAQLGNIRAIPLNEVNEELQNGNLRMSLEPFGDVSHTFLAAYCNWRRENPEHASEEI